MVTKTIHGIINDDGTENSSSIDPDDFSVVHNTTGIYRINFSGGISGSNFVFANSLSPNPKPVDPPTNVASGSNLDHTGFDVETKKDGTLSDTTFEFLIEYDTPDDGGGSHKSRVEVDGNTVVNITININTKK